MFDDVVKNADRLSTYRQICAQVARENNLIACFMSKPFMGVSASGCHTNISLWKGGKDELNKLHNEPFPVLTRSLPTELMERIFHADTDDIQKPGKLVCSAWGA